MEQELNRNKNATATTEIKRIVKILHKSKVETEWPGEINLFVTLPFAKLPAVRF